MVLRLGGKVIQTSYIKGVWEEGQGGQLPPLAPPWLRPWIGLCFNYGRLGHEAKYCGNPNDVEGNENQYGDWLKGGYRKQNNGESQYHYSPPRRNAEANSETHSTAFAESEQPPAKPSPQHRKTNPVISGTIMVTHMSQAGIKDITDMGVSIPNKAGSETVAPTHNVHTKCGELLSHTAPTEGKLVSVPISYVVEEDPNSRYVSETQKQQTPNHEPKPKAQENKKTSNMEKD